MAQVRTIVAAGFGAAFLLAFTAGTASATEWHVDKKNSSVGIVGLQQGSQFNGGFADFDAKVSFDPKAPMKGKIVGTVKTASINTRDNDRDSQLPEADWFDSDKYPEARYESKSIKKLANGSYEADGQLTLKGKTKPMKFTFTFKTMNGGKSAKLDGKMTVDRFDFGIGEDYADTTWVGSKVDVNVVLDLEK